MHIYLYIRVARGKFFTFVQNNEQQHLLYNLLYNYNYYKSSIFCKCREKQFNIPETEKWVNIPELLNNHMHLMKRRVQRS